MSQTLLLVLFGAALALLIATPLALLWARRSARRADQLARRARAAERLAELGSLTGGLAHEIKNPLATLRINLDLLSEDLRDATPAGLEDLQRRGLNRVGLLRREAQRLDDILDDFLRYAGRHEMHVERVNLNQVVQDLLEFYAPQASAARVRLRPGLTPDPLTVRLDVDLFKQAILNLLINAQQAMSETSGGELIVRTQKLDGRASLEVADTGPGIEPARLERIFQAYYSTKQGGSGLGLPTTRRIVEEHDGTIEVHSQPGRGTSFIIRLPLAEE
ncbi:MAG: Sensor protein ZraS [Phycisphaerae bacterium]|nr:Sensor protein ZraS [Phycisphaerae bacterium]